jgi:O-antigen/teichoic acid export membrane protein
MGVSIEAVNLPAVPARRIAGYAGVSFATSLAMQALGLISGTLLARLLGPTGRGELAAVLLWPGILTVVGSVGLTDAMVYVTAREPGRQRAVFATGALIALVQSAALMIAGHFLLPLVLGHFDAETTRAANLYLLWIPLNLLTLAAMTILQGSLSLVAFNVLRLTLILSTVLGLLALYLVQEVSLWTIAQVYIAANLITLIGSFATVASFGWLGFRPEGRLIRPMLLYGLKSHAGNVSALVNERADQALISVFLAPTQLGLYAVSVTISSAIALIGSTFSTVAFPVLSMATRGEQRRRDFARFTHATLWLSACTALAMIFATPVIIDVFFGSAFIAATNVTQVLLIAAIPLSTKYLISAALKAINKPLAPSVAEVISAVVTIAALGAFLPLLGLMGAAFASLLAYITSLVYMAIMARQHLRMGVCTLLFPTKLDIQWLVTQLRGWNRPAARQNQ